MPKASIEQNSFLGGEWGPFAQGRADDPKYSTALATSLNGYPVEEGAWTVRAGTEFIVPTHSGLWAQLLAFNGSETCSFAMEFTSPANASNGVLRLLTQSSLVCTNDAQTINSVNTSTNVITLSGNPSWSVGDEVFIVFPDITGSPYPFPLSDECNLRNQICTITAFTSATNATMQISGFFTGAVTFAASTNLVGAQVLHVKSFLTPYTGGQVQLSQLRAVQAEVDSIILCPSVAPQQLQITTQGTLSADPVFTFGAVTMVDGPYLNPQTQTLSLSGTSGSITLTAGSAAFASTDVGRAVRIFTQPAIYNASSTYSAGNLVTDSNGAWWVALQSISAGWTPGVLQTVNSVTTQVWGPAPTAGSWAWGLITAYTNSTTVSFTFDTTIPNMVLQSGNGTTAYEWQMGVYSGTTGYPTCGVYYEGRLWLAGCVPNRFDTTISNGVSQIIGTNTATFSPTDPYGNVLDSSGISLTLNSQGINQIQWMIGDASGVLCGTLSGETLIAASQLSDPITPTSIQAHEVTRYGSLSIEARRVGMAVVFAQKDGRRVIEYLDDAFSQKFSGRHLNQFAKHLTTSGVARLEYTEEPVPIVWALMNNGLLAGCTYRRFSRFVQTPPECEAWHWNMHGANRVFTNICTVPGKDGLEDRLFLVTNTPTATVPNQPQNNGTYYIEIMEPSYDPALSLLQAQQLDQMTSVGPGNSGYDCGGGNASGFATTGGIQGADSQTASPTTELTNFQNVTLGQSPPAGGVYLFNTNKAVYFPGTVCLYNLPPWPLTGGRADKTNLSMSVWCGIGDFPLTQGALLSAPGLTSAEATAGSKITSAILGNGGGGYPYPYASDNAGIVGTFSKIADGFATAYADIVTSGNTQWVHIMISAKSNGDGTFTILCVCNDTTVYNGSIGASSNHGDMWEFSTNQDMQKNNGMDVWCIGGQWVQNPNYNVTITATEMTNVISVLPPLQTLIGSQLANLIYQEAESGQRPTGAFAGTNLTSATLVAYTGTNAPSLSQLWDALFVGKTKLVNYVQTSETVNGGGPCNFPIQQALGALTGYIGNIAELWIMPGQYIDWTSSTNRYKFHEYDSVTEAWGPIPLGTTGSGPGFGTPWIYCSGGPSNFPMNNATGNYLTEMDTTSGLVNFQTGLGGGLQESQLSFP